MVKITQNKVEAWGLTPLGQVLGEETDPTSLSVVPGTQLAHTWGPTQHDHGVLTKET